MTGRARALAPVLALALLGASRRAAGDVTVRLLEQNSSLVLAGKAAGFPDGARLDVHVERGGQIVAARLVHVVGGAFGLVVASGRFAPGAYEVAVNFVPALQHPRLAAWARRRARFHRLVRLEVGDPSAAAAARKKERRMVQSRRAELERLLASFVKFQPPGRGDVLEVESQGGRSVRTLRIALIERGPAPPPGAARRDGFAAAPYLAAVRVWRGRLAAARRRIEADRQAREPVHFGRAWTALRTMVAALAAFTSSSARRLLRSGGVRVPAWLLDEAKGSDLLPAGAHRRAFAAAAWTVDVHLEVEARVELERRRLVRSLTGYRALLEDLVKRHDETERDPRRSWPSWRRWLVLWQRRILDLQEEDAVAALFVRSRRRQLLALQEASMLLYRSGLARSYRLFAALEPLLGALRRLAPADRAHRPLEERFTKLVDRLRAALR